ncbi:methylenetetrahydrofolate reductase [Buchnera aphidicola]|nr:methylenetetrahydrofolate reductase [Buchnera aphidicola]
MIIKNFNQKYNHKSYNLKNKIKISFEVFPPSNSFLEDSLLNSVRILNQCRPDFFSVTSSTRVDSRNKTFLIIQKIRVLTNAIVFAHFTSAGLTTYEINDLASQYWNNGIKNIIALRGDLPDQCSQKVIYASDLIKLLNLINNFEIWVAAYPEIHPESRNLQEDLINLKKKSDLGVKNAITQFFFSVEKFIKFREKCLNFGLDINLIPGILPILNMEQLKKFSNMTRVDVPKWIFSSFEKFSNNEKQRINLSVNIAVNLIMRLYHEGIRHFHLYTLNQSYLSLQICQKLGLI